MAETTADVRRDIELTRERMSTTIAQLEQKMNVMQVVRDHPWPALGLAVGAGFLFANSQADIKAAAASVAATGGASNKIGSLLDDLAARLISGVTMALNERVDSWVDELKQALGAPSGSQRGAIPRAGSTQAASVVDRQMSGRDINVERTRADDLLGIDQSVQDSGALRTSSTAY